MGCTPSAFFERWEELRKSPKFVKWNETFVALGLKDKEVKELYRVFWKADMDGGGTIDLVELLTIVDLERTPFTERIFSIFDDDQSGKIDFGEFVLALWNYCTLSSYTLAIFAFDLYDRDSTGVLEQKDLELMLKDIYGKEWKKNHYAKQIMKDLEERNGCNDDAVVVDSFIEFSTSHQYLLFPAFQMQLLLRTKVMGITFWEQQSMRRLKTCDGKYLKLEDYLSFVTKKDFRGADGWLAPKSKPVSKKERNSVREGGERGSTRTKTANALDEILAGDCSAPNAAIVPKRRQSQDLGRQRRGSREHITSPFVSPRANPGPTPRTGGGTSSARVELFASPRINNYTGGGTGSNFVSPRQARPGTRNSFVAINGETSTSPAIAELEQLISNYHGIPGGNGRRKSITATSPKGGAVVPDDFLASGGETKFETNAGPVTKNKKRRGSI